MAKQRILLVEDNPSDVLLLNEWLAFSGEEYDVVHTDRLGGALDHLKTGSFEAIILDLGLPDSAGLDTFLRLHENAPDLPVLVMTGLADHRMGLLAVQNGAQDYLVKQEVQPTLLARSIHYAVERMRFERLLLQQNQKLESANQSLQREIEERQIAQMEAARNRDEKLRLKGEFLSHVSHELRTPLAVVYQYTTVLIDGLAGSLTDAQREYLEISLNNVNELKYMIDDLLDASRSETGKLTVKRASIRIGDLIAESVKSHSGISQSHEVSLNMEIAPNLPEVYADPTRISQVIANLLDNATKFSSPNSSVTVRAGLSDDDPGLICVSVVDSGCGIAPEDAGRVFDRLYQVKDSIPGSRQGLGMGLYICKEIVQLHDGRIWVDANWPSGSAFRFTLPIFTLETSIRPVLMHDGRIVPSVALIQVELSAESPSERESNPEKVAQQIARVLERCIMPDIDTLLPCQHWNGNDVLSVLARTDENGAKVLVSRIREQLTRRGHLEAAGMSWSVHSEIIDLKSVSGDLSAEAAVAHVTARCAEGLLSRTEKGTVCQ